MRNANRTPVRPRSFAAPATAALLATLAASDPAGAWELERPPGCEANGIHWTYPLEFAINTTEIYNAPGNFRPASTSIGAHRIRFLADVLAAKEAIDDVGDSSAVFPYDALTWPHRYPADPQNIQNADYPLVGDGRSEIGFIPIVDPLGVAAVPWVIYDETTCGVVESDVWLSSLYWWAFNEPDDHGEPNYGAGLCVGGAIRPGLGCGLLSQNEPMFVRPVLLHEFLAVLGFAPNIGQHSFRNNGTYPWQPGSHFLDPELVLLPDDRAGLRAHYPPRALAGELDVAVVNTYPDASDGGRNKLLCRPGSGWLPSTSAFDDHCSRMAPPATMCPGDVISARFAIVNNGTSDVQVTAELRFTPAAALPAFPAAPRIAGGSITVAAGATELVHIRQYLPGGLSAGVEYRVWGGADTGALLAQETNGANNLTPLRSTITMGTSCGN